MGKMPTQERKMRTLHFHKKPILCMALVSIAVLWWVYGGLSKKSQPNSAQFRLPHAILDLTRQQLKVNSKLISKHTILTLDVGKGLELSNKEFTTCSSPKNHQEVCLEWKNIIKLQIKYKDVLEYDPGVQQNGQCYSVDWTAIDDNVAPEDCVPITSGTHWYGGPSTYTQRWPIQQQNISMKQYLPNDVLMDKKRGGIGAVLERYWLSSDGVAIYVNPEVPLHYSSNSNDLCFKADYKKSLYEPEIGRHTHLSYTVCSKGDPRSTHLYMMGKYIDKPQGIPDTLMFTFPIWSTWAQYKTNITQEKVLQFAKEIRRHELHGCQMEIDDMYTPTHGDFRFDPKKFPTPQSMTMDLKNSGFRVSSWITPFANPDSDAFKEGATKGYFVKNKNGETAITRWWNGHGYIIDFTNPKAVEWFSQRLKELREVGVDTFKFDAGELDYLPPNFKLFKSTGNPAYYTTAYAEAVYAASDTRLENRVGWKTQKLPVWVRMLDKLSTWDYDLGLKSLIPSVLQFGMAGYPFVLPDMIGGNGYTENFTKGSSFPDKELFVRWLQVNTFFPTMQMSIAPWQYDSDTVAFARKYIDLHAQYANLLIDLAKESVKTGAPIIRPLWWADPKDPITFDIDSQFLVGDTLLVAPILNRGERSRDIYLPQGQWEDKLRGKIYNGWQWLKQFPVDLGEIAYFERLK